MRITFIRYIFSLLLFTILGCSDSTNNSNQIHFTINPEDRKIVLPLKLNDSITANLVFDSGAGLGTFILDSTFCANHPGITRSILPFTKGDYGGSAWSNTSFPALIYDSTPKVSLGSFALQFDHMEIYDRKRYFGNPLEEGMFNIPKNDKTHVWELNFENNYLEIHPISEFEMPENCLVAQIEKGENLSYPFNIKLPFYLTCVSGDTITLNRTFTVDTGMPWDIALMGSAEEMNFFNGQDDAVWIGYLASYYRYYTVDARLFDRLDLDSLRIYTFNHSNRVKSNYLVGQNFLKRFNVFFDMKNQQIGLQPIKNFERVVDPLAKRFHVSFNTTPEGRIFVDEVGDYKTNYYKTAGFQKGDEIINLNGKSFQTLTIEEKKEFQNLDSLVFDIIRNKKPLIIVVYVDKNEEKGE
jgi:hypothetical protein